MKWLFTLILCLVLTPVYGQTNFYIGNSGLTDVPGTPENPLDFKYFMSIKQQVAAGDVIYFMPDVYYPEKRDFSTHFNFAGTEANPVIIKPYNHGRVIFQSPLTDANIGTELPTSDIVVQLNGSYVHMYDMIVTADKSLNKTTHNYTSLPVPQDQIDAIHIAGVYINGPGCKFINGVVHNVTASGLNSPESGIDGEFYGNIVFNIGNMERSQIRDKGHGHLLYFQNKNGRKTIENNLFFKSYGNGLQFYSASGAGTGGSDIKNNITFMATTLSSIGAIGGRYNYLVDSEDQSIVDGNVSYHYDKGSHYTVGYVKRGNSIKLNNNSGLDGHYGISYKNFNHVDSQNNYLVMDANHTTNSYGPVYTAIHYPDDGIGTPYQYIIDYNTYYSNGADFSVPGNDRTLQDWQDYTGVDSNSTGSHDTDLSTLDNKVFVFPNKYESKRAHIAIYNHKNSAAVSVNPNKNGEVLKPGDDYWLYDVEDLRQPIQKGIYQGGELLIPTNQTSQFPLYGTNVYAQPVHSRNNFGAFLLIGRELKIELEKPQTVLPGIVNQLLLLQ